MSSVRASSASSSDEEGSFVSSASSEAVERAGRLPALRRFIVELPAARGAAASASCARRGSDEPTPPPRALVRAGVLDSTGRRLSQVPRGPDDPSPPPRKLVRAGVLDASGRRLLFGPVAASAIRALKRADKKRAAGSASSAPSYNFPPCAACVRSVVLGKSGSAHPQGGNPLHRCEKRSVARRVRRCNHCHNGSHKCSPLPALLLAAVLPALRRAERLGCSPIENAAQIKKSLRIVRALLAFYDEDASLFEPSAQGIPAPPAV
ncbi:hypothetical protein S40288_11664 [Stachybotrys chartarum IBT 40288]|nr:hypothetical protein S40288_11664 [Stachybotrys chartarum IBT 40288]